ncbi:MAG: IS110 family transposase [Syntrophobacteraceae bacterium]
MEPIYTSCCGLDVHKKSIQACVRRGLGKSEAIQQAVRSFGTMTRDIVALADWLLQEEVTHVAMESTGVYWKPIYNILEGRFTILLVNARHVKNVPGRKTDVKDCQWLAELLQCGLLKGSFIPDRAQREFRDLTRHRAKLVDQRASVVNRVHKVLEDANVKLGSVATDIMGKSGKDMIRALIEGEKDSAEIAELARRQLRGKIPQLRLALDGHVTDHHRFMLAQLIDQLDYVDRQIDLFSQRIEEVSRPFAAAIEEVMRLPGFKRGGSENVIAEIGCNMDQFPSADHLNSWAGICSGNNRSADKNKGGKTTKGSKWLRDALAQAAWAASNTKNSYFYAQYRRLAGRRGKKRAVIAVAHSLLTVIYHVLKTHVEYKDLGRDYFDKLNSKRLVPYLVNRLKNMGYEVHLVPLQSAA